MATVYTDLDILSYFDCDSLFFKFSASKITGAIFEASRDRFQEFFLGFRMVFAANYCSFMMAVWFVFYGILNELRVLNQSIIPQNVSNMFLKI